MRDEWREIEDTLEGGDTLYPSSADGGAFQEDLQGDLQEDTSYTEQVQACVADAREYVTDTWEFMVEEYVDHELSGYDRFQDAVAEAVVEYSPDIENPYAEAVAESAVEFGRSLGQAVSGALTAPSAIYDAVQKWEETGVHPVSPYVQMEEYRGEDGSFAELAGKAAGFTIGAAIAVQYPVVMAVGAAQTGRHLAERKAHHYLRERVLGEDPDEIAEDDGVQELYNAVTEATREGFDAALERQR